MRMTRRLLSRTNDQAVAAQSAVMVVPKRRIGFLIMPTVISTLIFDMVPRRRFANQVWLAGACICQIFSTKSRPSV